MQIDVFWLQPLDLWEASADNLIYDCDWAKLPNSPGVYVFARCFGESISPLYVGKARNLRRRVLQQLKTNTPLMKFIENSKNGSRVVLPAKVCTCTGRFSDHAITLTERSLIEHYLSENHELHNTQGTRIVADEITFGGNTSGRQTCPGRLVIPRRKTPPSE